MLLSLEFNKITSLVGFPDLKNLLELYLSHNLIKDIKEIVQLSELQKLIILDLSSNECSINPSYRVSVIYNLRKLKVLDGLNIDNDE